MLFAKRFLFVNITVALLAAAVVMVPTLVSAQARNTVRIVGSSTVFPFAALVAERFSQATRYPAPIVESTGTGGGIKLFCQGVGAQHPDITNASRRMTKSEFEFCQSQGVMAITEVKIGYDGIVLASAREAEPINLSRPQLWQALAKTVPVHGKLVDNPYKRWKEIDPSLPDKDIKVYGPPPTSGTRDAVVELVMQEGCKQFQEVQQLDKDRQKQVCDQVREDGAFVEAGENDNVIIQRLQKEPQAYGIFGFSFLDQNRDKIQSNSIEGVQPTFDTISGGSYAMSRPLFFYVKNPHVGVIRGIKEYIAEFTSPQAWGANGYLVDKGLIPLPDAQRTQMAKQAQSLQPLQLSGL
jgi:phosphate transport system substrate-binding protein